MSVEKPREQEAAPTLPAGKSAASAASGGKGGGAPAPSDTEHGEHAQPLHAVRPAVPPKPDDAAGFAAVLRRGDFRYLWLAQVFSQLGDKFFAFTLLIVVYDLSHSASLPSLVMIAYTFPSVFLSAPAGVYADRHDKRTLMLATNLIRAGLLLLVPISQLLPFLRHAAWPLLIITFLFSSVGQVFAPAEAASIPSLVSRTQISAATSLFMTTVILTLVLGVPLAPLCIRLFGNFAPFYVAAGLFGLAALAIYSIGKSLRAVERGTAPESHVLAELREGLLILRSSPALRLGLLQLTVSLVAVFTVFALGPAYMDRELGRSDQDTYIVLIPATLGLISMAAVLGQRAINPSRAALMVTALLAAGGCLVAIGIAPRILGGLGLAGLLLPLVIVFSGVFGCALGAILIPAFTVLQEGTTEESRGRIFGGIFTVINAAIAVPLLVAGLAADLLHSVAGVIAVLGVILIAIGVICRTLAWPALAVLDQVEPIPAESMAETRIAPG